METFRTAWARAARRGLAAAGVLVALTLATASAQDLFTPSQDPVAGARAFRDKGCGRCHAIDGVGGNPGAPDLGKVSRSRNFFDLAAAMWNHLPRMADRMRALGIARPTLSAPETGDIAAFLFTLGYFDPPGNAEAGRRLFTAKRCVACHQLGGVGGVVGPNLDALAQAGSPIFVGAAMWNHGPAMTATMRARKLERPTFTEQELRDLLAYVRAAAPAGEGPIPVLPGRPEAGRRLFAEKRCGDCHGAGGSGRGVGPNLGDRAVQRSLLGFAAAMWNKAPAMLAAMRARGVGIPQLKPEEMADIVAYLYSVQYFGGTASAQRGARLVRDKGCLGCHTLHARDGAAPVELAAVRGLDSPAAVIAALWNHSFVTGAPPKGPWPAFKPEEMADLMAFLRSLVGAF